MFAPSPLFVSSSLVPVLFQQFHILAGIPSSRKPCFNNVFHIVVLLFSTLLVPCGLVLAPWRRLLVLPTLQRKSHLCISKKGIVRPQS
jgi:hypothetical protein